MATKYFDTDIGEFVYPWVNKPDTKFAAGGAGVYKSGLRLRGASAEAQKAKIDVAVDAAFDAFAEEKAFTPKDRKLWTKHYPYDVEEDDNGNPTGSIVFKFAQNASITIKKTGEVKMIKIGLYDAAGKEMHAPVFSGSKGRIRYSMRAAPQTSAKKVGIRLDFAMVQISEMAKSGAGDGFGALEGGYVEDEVVEDNKGFGAVEGTVADGADY